MTHRAVLPAAVRADRSRDRGADRRGAARRRAARSCRHRYRRARSGASVRSDVSSTAPSIVDRAGGDARRRLPHHRAFRGARAGRRLSCCCTAEPFRDFVAVARKLFPDSLRPRSLFDAEGVAPGAIVHPTAEIEDGVTIDPGAVIGPRAAIGSGTVIGANAVIGPDVQIGRDCSVGPGASIVHALIGDDVIMHAGCRIGQDGFRYQPSAQGPRQGSAARPRHHPGQRRDRRQHHDRPRRQRRHRDRRGHQDR